jgi:hypothetical protein
LLVKQTEFLMNVTMLSERISDKVLASLAEMVDEKISQALDANAKPRLAELIARLPMDTCLEVHVFGRSGSLDVAVGLREAPN